MPYNYFTFGFSVVSNKPIPGLIEISSSTFTNPDIQINFGVIPDWFDQTSKSKLKQFYESPYDNGAGDAILKAYRLQIPECILLVYADDTRFLIDQSSFQVWATWPDNLTLEDTATYLLGPVLGLLLRLKGIVCLHASAVVIDETAFCFLGQAGHGKSTTAAAFARSGYSIISDDIVALSEQDDQFYILPGYPRIRLWPESGEEIFGAKDALPLLTPNWDKQYLDLNTDNYKFAKQPLPLTTVYILGDRGENMPSPAITIPTKRNAFMALVENTYMNYLLSKEMRAWEFEVLNRLIESVAIRHVTPQDDISFLNQLCQSVVADYQKLSNHI